MICDLKISRPYRKSNHPLYSENFTESTPLPFFLSITNKNSNLRSSILTCKWQFLENQEIRQTRRRFGGRQPLCGIGVTSRIDVTRIPACATARMADSRPPPGPFTRTSTSRIPASAAFLAASLAACWAAKGVPFLEPRNPFAPLEDCATKFPLVSVIEISVLLKDAAM